MFLKTFAVVFIKDGAPGIDVDDGHSPGDEQHECELHHVADLHQHDGGDEGQHGDIVVILGVLDAAVFHLQPCSAVGWACVVLETAELEARTVGRRGHGAQGNSRHWSEAAGSWPPRPTAPSETRTDGTIYQGTRVQKLVIPAKS